MSRSIHTTRKTIVQIAKKKFQSAGHTQMVCAEVERLAEWPSLDRAAQLKLSFTALFHDSGKPATTALDPATGRTRSPKHALVGAKNHEWLTSIIR